MRRLAAVAPAAVAPAIALVLGGCGSSGSSGSSDNPIVAAAPPATNTVHCSFTQQADDTGGKQPGLPPAAAPSAGKATAALVTNRGTLVFTMDRSKTPCTAASFAFLARKKFFDDTPCHRLVTSSIFVLQCGDPTGSGNGGPGYTIPDEALTGATYPAGTIAMANTGSPHTGGSQFFICYANTPLPPSYTPFGHVTTGLDVVKRVAAAGDDGSISAGGGKPKLAVTITAFTVTG
jgi:peptidyl-prolyl cis-trans isomerase B (cyclophilin B)